MLKKTIKSILKKIGYEIRKTNLKRYPYDIDNEHIKLFEEIEYATATTLERVDALLNAIDYLERNKIIGDFVECGVWKGGSCMAMAKKLLKNDSNKRKIWLFDTFEGMTEPDENDIEVETGIRGKELLANADRNSEKYNMWAYAPLNEVKNNMKKTGYPVDNIKYIIGKVEDTLKAGDIPEKVSLLIEFLLPKVPGNNRTTLSIKAWAAISAPDKIKSKPFEINEPKDGSVIGPPTPKKLSVASIEIE